MSPRRSSRARASQQPSPALLQHANSSSSSSGSQRGERSTRSNHKVTPPRRPSTQRSQSIDDVDGGSKNDFPHTRQRLRTNDDDPDQASKNGDNEEDPEEPDEEEEITRCLCGQQEYPGLPPSRRELFGRGGPKNESAVNLHTDSSDLLSDDIGSMFIQCDNCQVWQHGGCVGIMDEAMSPDEYFCEECRKDLHRIRGEPNGQRSSQYLPVAPSSPAVSSRASSRDNSKRVKDPRSRQSDSAMNPKRRSTMNSRDAAYDEEEQLKRAIEESKEETRTSAEEVANRRGKRSRSDSEANKQTTKRQRTSSPSPAAPSKRSNSVSQAPSDEESKTKAATNGTRKRAVRNQREKETKEPEEAEAEHPEMANRRKSRSDRRKGEDSDHEAESPEKPNANDAEPSRPSPDTPAPVQEPPPRQPTRKSGRPPARRGGKLGRNQYTRDRDMNGNGDLNHLNSPRRGQSHDVGGDSPRGRVNGAHLNGGDPVKPSRPRYMNPHRTTMTEMKRRVAGILEFISRLQVEMAVSGESASTPSGNGDLPNGEAIKNMVDQIETAMASTASDGGESGPATDGEAGGQPQKEKDFKDLSSVEMMDVLTRHLLKWQQEYGKFGER